MASNNRYNGDFTCDKGSKEYFISQTTDYINAIKPEWTVSWYGVNTETDEEGNVTKFEKVELGKEDSTARTDLIMDLQKGSRKESYMIELKERWEDDYGNPYYSYRYGRKNQPLEKGWIYNIEKDSILRLASAQGYIPAYANVYPDNIVRFWNISKVPPEHIGSTVKNIKIHNVEKNSPKIPQGRYTLMNNDGVTYKDGARIKRQGVDVW